MNEALKTKWLRRFAKGEDALCKNVMNAKHGVHSQGCWCKKRTYIHGVGYWKSISILADFRAFQILFY